MSAGERAAWAAVSSVADLVAAVRWATPAWMYLERVPQVYLEPRQLPEALRLAALDPKTAFDGWERGRVFDAGQELRWERGRGEFHAVYCGAAPPAGMAAVELGAEGAREPAYYLWGQQVRPEDRERIGRRGDKSAFIELRIPRVLHYPVTADVRRVRVRVNELLGADGGLRYARWAGVEEAP